MIPAEPLLARAIFEALLIVQEALEVEPLPLRHAPAHAVLGATVPTRQLLNWRREGWCFDMPRLRLALCPLPNPAFTGPALVVMLAWFIVPIDDQQGFQTCRDYTFTWPEPNQLTTTLHQIRRMMTRPTHGEQTQLATEVVQRCTESLYTVADAVEISLPPVCPRQLDFAQYYAGFNAQERPA